MKKFAKILLLLLILTIAITCLVACGHTCTYDQEVTSEDFIFSTATCTQKARYHYSCKCGNKGTETFERGEVLVHNYSILEKHDAVPKTCTTNGNIEYWQCVFCDKLFDSPNGINEITNSDLVVQASHTYWDDYTCHDRECNKCHEISTATSAHIYVDSKCGCGVGLQFGFTNNGTQYIVTGYNGNETDVVIPSKYNGKNVIGINNYAFNSCDFIKSITFDADSHVQTIGLHAFEGCTSLKSIILPNGVTSIEDGAFYYCSSLKDVVIPDSVESIGSQLFWECTSIEKVNYLGTIDQWAEINIESDLLNNIKLYVNDVLVEDVVLTTATKISDGAFYGYTTLTSIAISDSVTSIGENAFSGCTSLKEVSISENSRLDSIGERAFYDCTSLESITIPGNVTSIGESAFRGCTSLESITIPDSVKSIGLGAFSGCTSLESVTFGDNSQLESMDSLAFEDCTSLKSITIPDGLSSISYGAFWGCTSLECITIPDSVLSIGSAGFASCTSLAKVNYLGTINQWVEIDFDGAESNALDNGAGLYINNTLVCDVVITKVAKISSYAFYGYDYVTSITIGDGVTSIGEYAFSYCKALKSITISDSVLDIGMWAFNNCVSLETVTINDNSQLESIDKYAFYRCISLESVNFGTNSQITSIGNAVFSFCIKLKSVTIPDSVTSVGNEAFSNCWLLASIVIPDSVTIMGKDAFYKCNALIIYCEVSSELEDWRIDWNSSGRPVYWYSETEPTTEGNYWHYVDGVVTVW